MTDGVLIWKNGLLYRRSSYYPHVSRLSHSGRISRRGPAAEDDALLRLMQTPKARKGMEKAFNASPAELGDVAALAGKKTRQHTRGSAFRRYR